jgi:glucose-1-phosphate cytidylyltransferase
MKVVILAGGYGTRFSEYTDLIPKPLIEIAGEPIAIHIMRRYAKYGFKDFVLALGYKAHKFREYFANYKSKFSDISIDLGSGSIEFLDKNEGLDWKVTLIDTGLDTMTGGRLKRLSHILNETFMLTYGDGVSNVDINALVNFHKENKKILTLTAVRPNARFGELKFSGNEVVGFEEKPQLAQGWINGGFFVCGPKIFDYIQSDNEMLERQPMARLVTDHELAAYKHDGFWQCMDTKRDHENLTERFEKDPVWLK